MSSECAPKSPNAPDARLRGVGHPAPILVEPAAQRARVTVRVADAGNLAEVALFDLLLQKAVNRLTPHKIARLKEEAGVVGSAGHPVGVLGPEAQRFFDEQVFARLNCRHDNLFVPARFRADDDGFYSGVGINGVHVFGGSRAELGGGGFGPGFVVVEDVLDVCRVPLV